MAFIMLCMCTPFFEEAPYAILALLRLGSWHVDMSPCAAAMVGGHVYFCNPSFFSIQANILDRSKRMVLPIRVKGMPSFLQRDAVLLLIFNHSHSWDSVMNSSNGIPPFLFHIVSYCFFLCQMSSYRTIVWLIFVCMKTKENISFFSRRYYDVH